MRAYTRRYRDTRTPVEGALFFFAPVIDASLFFGAALRALGFARRSFFFSDRFAVGFYSPVGLIEACSLALLGRILIRGTEVPHLRSAFRCFGLPLRLRRGANPKPQGYVGPFLFFGEVLVNRRGEGIAPSPLYPPPVLEPVSPSRGIQILCVSFSRA